MPIEVTKKQMSEIMRSIRQGQCKSKFQIEEKEPMQNKLTDLNNHLFAEMERLSDEDLQGEALEKEISRAKAISEISTQIINNANLTLKTAEFLNEVGYGLNGNIERSIMGFVGNSNSEETDSEQKLLGNAHENVQ